MHTSYQTWPYQHIAFTSFLGVKAPLELANLVSVHRHKKVSKMQDLARPSYIRYLPTIICKDLLVLLSPLFVLGYVPENPLLLVVLSLHNDCISASAPPTKGLC